MGQATNRRGFIGALLGVVGALFVPGSRVLPIRKREYHRRVALEEAVLGAMMEKPAAVAGVVQSISRNNFKSPENAAVFVAIATLHDEGLSVNLKAVSHTLAEANTLEGIGGVQHLVQMIEGTPSSENALAYAESLACYGESEGE